MSIPKLLLKIALFNAIEPNYPSYSYIDTNHFGLCLRASQALEAGAIVATGDLEKTDKEYIAAHPSQEYKSEITDQKHNKLYRFDQYLNLLEKEY